MTSLGNRTSELPLARVPIEGISVTVHFMGISVTVHFMTHRRARHERFECIKAHLSPKFCRTLIIPAP